MPKLAQRDDEICHYPKSQVISGLDSKHSVSAPAIRQGSAGREFSLPGGVRWGRGTLKESQVKWAWSADLGLHVPCSSPLPFKPFQFEA